MSYGALNKLPIFASPAGQSFRLDKASATKHYYGNAACGSAESAAVWQIQEATIDAQGDITHIKFPKPASVTASSNYAYVWNDRASYTYE